MANDVAVGLAVLVAAKREDARRAEEDRLRAEEAARRRNEAKRLAYIEERRLKVLEAVLGRVEQRDRLRRLAKQLTEELEGEIGRASWRERGVAVRVDLVGGRIIK